MRWAGGGGRAFCCWKLQQRHQSRSSQATQDQTSRSGSFVNKIFTCEFFKKKIITRILMLPFWWEFLCLCINVCLIHFINLTVMLYICTSSLKTLFNCTIRFSHSITNTSKFRRNLRMFFFFHPLLLNVSSVFRSKFPESGGGYYFSRPKKETENYGASSSSSTVCKSVALNTVEFFSLFLFSFFS